MKRFIHYLLAAMCALAALSTAAAQSAQAEPAFPAAGSHRFSIAEDNSTITFFLSGNVHDTYGRVVVIKGRASAAVSAGGVLSDATAQLEFKAEDMHTDDARRDKRMKTKFLETEKYPKIIFRSTGSSGGTAAAALGTATRAAPVLINLQGELTIHGVAKTISLPMGVYLKNGRLVTEGDTVLHLQDYNIKNPSLLIFRTSNEVKITFHIELVPLSGIP